jgi:hypothetical protein
VPYSFPDRRSKSHCQLPELSVRFFALAASFACAAPYHKLGNFTCYGCWKFMPRRLNSYQLMLVFSGQLKLIIRQRSWLPSKQEEIFDAKTGVR